MMLSRRYQLLICLLVVALNIASVRCTEIFQSPFGATRLSSRRHHRLRSCSTDISGSHYYSRRSRRSEDIAKSNNDDDGGGGLLVRLATAKVSEDTPPRGGADGKKTMQAATMQMLNLLSGGVAGTISSTITNPLEVIKTQLQSSARGSPMSVAKKIMAEDGFSGFFRGLPPTLVGIIPARSIYFYAYQKSKRALSGIWDQGSPGNALFSGVLAGISSNVLTNPIWMVRTRMQLLADTSVGQQAYAGYRQCVAAIFKEEGIGGFYKGITASFWGTSEGAIQFVVYEQIKSRLLARVNEQRAKKGLPPTEKLSKLTYFLAAAFSKGVASIGTYPHEVARTRMREQARAGLFKYNGMWNTLGVIAREEGRAGLYSGMGVHLLKVVPNSAIMFLTYEIVNHWLNQYKVVNASVATKTKKKTV